MSLRNTGNKGWLPKKPKDDMMFDEFTGRGGSIQALAPIVAKHLDEVIIHRNVKPNNKGHYIFQELTSTFYKYVGKKNFTTYFRQIMKKDYDYKFYLRGKIITIKKMSNFK